METTIVSGSPPNEKTPFNTSESELHEKADRWHVSFRVPFAMIAFMALGVGFAVAHHCYYQSLQGQIIAGSSQEWAVRIGTGLAFLAKACLIASAAMSYQQHYWVLLRSRPVTFKGIDDIMGLLANPACFCNLEVLTKAWSSTVIALTIWCIPLSAITPPASLTAAVSVFEQRLLHPVPIIDWSRIARTTGGYGYYADVQPTLLGAVASTAYAGNILAMTPSFSNYTYPLTFHGPRLRCGDAKPKNNTSIMQSLQDYNASSFNYGLSFELTDRVFDCETWNVTYTVNFTFINGEQSSTVTGMRFGDRWNYTKPPLGEDPCLGGLCSFIGWHKAVAAIFSGRIWTGASTPQQSTTRLSETPLSNCVPKLSFGGPECPKATLEEAIEIFSENATLSIFGRLQTVYGGANTTTTPAEIRKYTTELTYTYNARSLLISYAAAVFATLLILVAGLVALRSNGVGHTSSFSGLVRTTRNKALDDWARGHCLGADPLERDMGKQKLQYGLLVSDGSSAEGDAGSLRHAAFGFAGTVTKLNKGDRCM